MSTIKGTTKRAAKVKWQREWDKAEVDRELHKIVSQISRTKYLSHTSKIVNTKLLRLRAGHAQLNDWMYKMKLSESLDCECGTDIQIIEHIIINCPNTNSQRETMIVQ